MELPGYKSVLWKINAVVPVIRLNDVDDILKLHSVWNLFYSLRKIVLTAVYMYLLKVLIYDVSDDQPRQIFVRSQLPQPKDIPVCWRSRVAMNSRLPVMIT